LCTICLFIIGHMPHDHTSMRKLKNWSHRSKEQRPGRAWGKGGWGKVLVDRRNNLYCSIAQSDNYGWQQLMKYFKLPSREILNDPYTKEQ
jgi:hypothetical protein